jgi:hypothetical protein
MTDRELNPETGRLEVKGYAPTIIIHGPEPSSGDTVTKLTAPEAESVARITGHGDVTLLIIGAGGVGRPGEARVVKQLQSWLKHQGLVVEFHRGEDNRGEDRRLKAGERTYAVQIVNAPVDPQLWKDASNSSGSAAGQADAAVEWIEDSIQKKVCKSTRVDRKSTILVLDAQHANPLTEPVIVKRYLEVKGDPSEQHGFAGVWIVGSSSTHCVRLGTSVV